MNKASLLLDDTAPLFSFAGLLFFFCFTPDSSYDDLTYSLN